MQIKLDGSSRDWAAEKVMFRRSWIVSFSSQRLLFFFLITTIIPDALYCRLYSRCCVAGLWNFSILQICSSIHSTAVPLSPLLHCWWPPFSFWSLWIWLQVWCIVEKYSICLFVFYFAWHNASGLIHVIACVKMFFLRLNNSHWMNIPHYLMNTWVSSTFWLLWVVLLWAYVCRYIFEILPSIWGLYI